MSILKISNYDLVLYESTFYLKNQHDRLKSETIALGRKKLIKLGFHG